MQNCSCFKAINLAPATASKHCHAQMGNVAAGRRRQSPAVEDRFTRPQRLVMQLPDMDEGRLRRLICSGDLAPCFDAAEDAVDGQAEECPICFYFYPSLNRSKCCGKGICTECFLQLMPSKTSEVVHCPFCKTKSYAIEYRGARMRSEKKFEQGEEKNFKEAKIREHLESQIAGETYSNFELANQVSQLLQA